MSQFEIEIKSLLGSKEKADELKKKLKELDPNLKLNSQNKQLNHYFIDGNKRIGSLVAVLFLNFNNFQFLPPLGDIFKMTMEVAQVKKSFEDIKNWFRQYSEKVIK